MIIYPLRTDYFLPVRNLKLFVFDDILKTGIAATQNSNPSELRYYPGGKAIVFEIKVKKNKYALKCWYENLGNLGNRYSKIDEFLKLNPLPYFVEFAYLENGILVHGNKFPIIRMGWVQGVSIKKYIAININNSQRLRTLADEFLSMVKALHEKQISHGDLQHDNIMIREDGTICLVDYDGLFVPSLAGEKDNIKGRPGYQHPNRNNLSYLSKSSDYFSELVIYLSIVILSQKPSLWKSIEKEERLLFSLSDFENPANSKIFKNVKKISNEIDFLTTTLEEFCKQNDVEKLLPLDHLIDQYNQASFSWKSLTPDVGKAVTDASVQINAKSIWQDLSPSKQLEAKDTTTSKIDESSFWNKLNQPIAKSINKVIQPQENIKASFWETAFQSVVNFWNKLKSKFLV